MKTTTHEVRAGFTPCRLPAPVPVPVPLPTRTPDRFRIALRHVGLATLILGASLGMARPAQAHYADDSMSGRLVDVGIKVRGHSAPLFMKPGDWNRRYFEAFEGRNYSIVLRNTTARRIAVLISVDGLNVVNGERSALRPSEPMYVLDPWSSAEIKGWRTSLDQVRRFVFVDERRSYAERTGQANRDMGWIRVLAFEENRPWWREPRVWLDEVDPRPLDRDARRGDDRSGRESELDARERETAPRAQEPAPSEKGTLGDAKGDARAKSFHSAPESVPGTGWGDRRYDPVRRTHFEPRPYATDHLVFRYEYASGLAALGLHPHRHVDRVRERDRGYLGFAKPPRW